ncbi:hypothetical protein ACMFMG_012243 [Clarireedia jacksonii]
MSPAANRVSKKEMATFSAAQLDKGNNDSSKVIYNGDNYFEFVESCTLALIDKRCLGIVLGTEQIPPIPNNQAELQWNLYIDGQNRRAQAIDIISSRVNSAQRSRLMPFIQAEDPAGMWNKLQRDDPGNNPIFVDQIRRQFVDLPFDPKTMKLRQFVDSLILLQSRTKASTRGITDEEVISQLFAKIPQTAGWQTSKIFALSSKMDLEAAVVVLQANETVNPVEHANAAQEVAYRGGYRGRGRGRSRGSRGGRGKPYDRNRRGRASSSSGSTDRNRDRSSGRGKEEKEGGSNQCWWCKKEGHYQADCYSYLSHLR